MSIKNVQDAREVHEHIDRIFVAPADQRAQAIRRLFVETLDFEPESAQVSLNSASAGIALPQFAQHIASLDGVHVCYIALDIRETDRVRKAEAVAAAQQVEESLDDDLLLVFTNTSGSQLHLIHPVFAQAQPTLRRMVVERDLPRRTAVQQIANIYASYLESGRIRAALDEAFDVEPVTKRFFAEYKRVFEDSEELIIESNSGKTADWRLFVQTIFNRLLFVHFLSRKRWLNFRGDTDYLKALWQNYEHQADRSKNANFYTDRLRPLFFRGLGTRRTRAQKARDLPIFGDVPFLNGGLFEQTDLDRRDDIDVPDGAIEPMLRDRTGLFDKFNFTVMESTPFDIEVAVDPEMLGKVFEELVTGRHDTGSYYTPRPVVAFMCREALKGYLESRTTGASPEAIRAFVDGQDRSAIGLDARPAVAVALSEITVVDPACGSGAYLLGMLQELVQLQQALLGDAERDSLGELYRLKHHIIERNLYGVDSDRFAVNIAMLRLWLSLTIEGKRPEPLPNLDFKIVRGDSLLGPDPSPGSYSDLFRHLAQSLDLGGLKAKYMSAVDESDKHRLKQNIAAVEDQAKNTLGDAGSNDWRIIFAEVFSAHEGFHVVIANPPYVQLQRDGGRLGDRYQGVGYQTFARTGDVYQLFYERGCQLLKKRAGMLAYITSNSWLRAEYGRSLRRYFTEEQEPLALLELGKDVFSSAIVDTSVLLLREGSAGGTFPAADVDHLPSGDFPSADSLSGRVRPGGEAPWSILSPLEQSIMDKMHALGTPLREWDIAIYRGITTGLNDAFIIDNRTNRKLMTEDENSDELLWPILRGRDIKRYQADWNGLWLIATFPALRINIDDYPAVKRHLLTFGKQRLMQSGEQFSDGTRSRKKTAHAWYEIQDTCAYHRHFKSEKLLWMDMTSWGRFSYSKDEVYCNDKGFIMTGESLKYLCAVLNSTLVTWLMQSTALTTGMGLPQWKKFAVERIPIPKPSLSQERAFQCKIDWILQTKEKDSESDTSVTEREVDRMVYQLYGLTSLEVSEVEERVSRL